MSNRSKRETDMSEAMVSAVRDAASYIEQRSEAEADGPVSLKELSDHTGISPWHLQRQFKRALDRAEIAKKASCHTLRYV